MTAVCAAPPRLAGPAPAPPATTATTAVAFHYTQTENFPALLRELKASLLVTTYQANKLLVVRELNGGLSTLVRTFERPVGLAVDARRLALCTRGEVWLLRNAPDIAPKIEPAGQHDACFVPRSCHVTGDIAGHEVAWGGDELWVINSRFSCLCTLHPDYSFVPRWRPPFITALAPEDRCHLSGLTIEAGQPRYVTALGESDTPGGWRPNKPQGGCLMDVLTNEVVARGFCMPHSPRLYDGQLWLLESGTGRLMHVDPAAGSRETVAELPGFARGLALCKGYAFIGLSKIRPTSAMDGVPLAERRNELKCGVAVVELNSGRTVAMLEFQSAVEELFDVQLLLGLRFPEIIGLHKEQIHHTFIVPSVVPDP